ncbi:hypothetical protein F5887DRAFT_550643 [Amanita rubescens]|nr:hypothetical protein F5887DRAFT_550643 [Amanita rubescens]
MAHLLIFLKSNYMRSLCLLGPFAVSGHLLDTSRRARAATVLYYLKLPYLRYSSYTKRTDHGALTGVIRDIQTRHALTPNGVPGDIPLKTAFNTFTNPNAVLTQDAIKYDFGDVDDDDPYQYRCIHSDGEDENPVIPPSYPIPGPTTRTSSNYA